MEDEKDMSPRLQAAVEAAEGLLGRYCLAQVVQALTAMFGPQLTFQALRLVLAE